MRFSTKIMLTMVVAVMGVSGGLGVAAYRVAASFYRQQFLQHHVADVAVIGDMLAEIENVVEHGAANALMAVREIEAQRGIPETAELQALAAKLGVYNIYFTNQDGYFIRWARGTLKNPERSLFDHCAGYENLLHAPGRVEQTPIILSAGDISSGLYKFSMTANARGTGIIEVSTPANFISRVLASAVAANENIEAVHLFSGSEKLLTSLTSSEPSAANDATFLPTGEYWDDNTLRIVRPLWSRSEVCCECLVKGTIKADTDAPLYYIATTISQKPLLASLKQLRQTMLLASAAVCTVGLAVVYGLCRVMLGRLARLIHGVKVMSTGGLSSRVCLGGKDELATLGSQIDMLAHGLQQSQEQLVATTRVHVRAETASKVAHDIRTPLAALKCILPSLHTLPDELRNLTRAAVTRIEDIADELLEQRAAEKREGCAAAPVLLQPLVASVVRESRLSHASHRSLSFELAEDAELLNLFVAMPGSDLRRVLANLLNNAAEAIFDQGVIRIHINTSDEKVVIDVEDNGQGMPPQLLARLGEEEITSNKAHGNGIGVVNSRQMLARWGGTLTYKSSLGKGTIASVTLPRSAPPRWFADAITLHLGEHVVVLDDDPSMHELWRTRLWKHPSLQGKLIHHKSSKSLKEWLIKRGTRENCMFLVDFELARGDLDGLEVIEDFELNERAILVTSQFDDGRVQRRCAKMGLQILPKFVAAHAPIIIEGAALSANC